MTVASTLVGSTTTRGLKLDAGRLSTAATIESKRETHGRIRITNNSKRGATI